MPARPASTRGTQRPLPVAQQRAPAGDHPETSHAMIASASRSTSGATARVRLRTRAVARVAILAALLALCAALGESTMQLATAAVPTGAGPYTMFGGTA